MSLRVVNKLLNTVRLSSNLYPKQFKYFYTSKTVESSSPQQKQQAEQKMDKFKSNPYFSKYEAKLKAVYEYKHEALILVFNLANLIFFIARTQKNF